MFCKSFLHNSKPQRYTDCMSKRYDQYCPIAHALGLRTIIWKYDSNDWREGTANITAADIDANYEALITRVQNGTFSTVSKACPLFLSSM